MKYKINVITQLAQDLTDIYALSLVCCAPSGVVHIYQSNPSQLCYNILIYIYMHTYMYMYIYVYIHVCICIYIIFVVE